MNIHPILIEASAKHRIEEVYHTAARGREGLQGTSPRQALRPGPGARRPGRLAIGRPFLLAVGRRSGQLPWGRRIEGATATEPDPSPCT